MTHCLPGDQAGAIRWKFGSAKKVAFPIGRLSQLAGQRGMQGVGPHGLTYRAGRAISPGRPINGYYRGAA